MLQRLTLTIIDTAAISPKSSLLRVSKSLFPLQIKPVKVNLKLVGGFLFFCTCGINGLNQKWALSVILNFLNNNK